MKKIILATILFSSTTILAEDVNVNLNSSPVIKSAKKYEVKDGSEEIAGAPAVLKKTAEENWKKACSNWKSEFKNSNKDNQIISHNCGKMICTKEGVESTCASHATYKVKILIEE